MNLAPNPSGSPQANTGPKPGRRRIDWIDLFRGAAVLVMIETHVVNTFMATSLRAEGWFTILNYINGLVAPSFLFIAGFVQGLTWTSAAKKIGPRLRRLLGILAVAYALHIPWAELGQHRWADALRVGTQVDVLQCIAVSLALVLLAAWFAHQTGEWSLNRVASKSTHPNQQSSPNSKANPLAAVYDRRQFPPPKQPLAIPPSQDHSGEPSSSHDGTPSLAAQRRADFLSESIWWFTITALLLFVVLFAPTAAKIQNLPTALQGWVNNSTASWFPLFPWAGFVFVGALTGAALRPREPIAAGILPLETITGNQPAPALAETSPQPSPAASRFRPSTLLISPIPLALSAWAFRGPGYSPVTLASFLERTAWVFVFAAICEWLAAKKYLPKLIVFAGQRSLTLYVTHLVLISNLAAHGVPERAFPLPTVIGMIFAIMTVSLAITWAIASFQTRRSQSAGIRE